jgi:hypothetical protein
MFDNNLVYNNAINWRYNHNGASLNILNSFQSVHNVTGNPKYMNPSTGIYVLGSTSAAKGTGKSNAYSPRKDMRGKVRPVPPSIGGYEP